MVVVELSNEGLYESLFVILLVVIEDKSDDSSELWNCNGYHICSSISQERKLELVKLEWVNFVLNEVNAEAMIPFQGGFI